MGKANNTKKRLTVKDKNNQLESLGDRLKLYGIKIKLYHTEKQKLQIHQAVGCARYIFNQYLGMSKDFYESTGLSLSSSEFKSYMNNTLKQLHPWLKSPDKYALETAVENVETAYKNFFNGTAGFPKFKNKKNNKQSYTTKANKTTKGNYSIRIEEDVIQLPKLGKIKFKGRKPKDGRITKATISFNNTGDYFASLTIEEVVAVPSITAITAKDVEGYDLGLMDYLTDSKGNKIENPKHLQKALRKLRILQKSLSRSQIGSNKYAKKVKKVAKQHRVIANLRNDFLHQLSRRLINDNQIKVYVFEDLNVSGMVKNHGLAKSISDASWSTFTTFMNYKAEWAGKKVIYIDRFYASSKLCSNCGAKNITLKLNQRDWVCSSCHSAHDRDTNAAINIKKEGIRLLELA